MLSESILHGCMVQLLLSPTDEKSLECFAVLITTAGKELEMGGAKVGVVTIGGVCVGDMPLPYSQYQIDQYISRVNDIIKKGKLPSQIRSALQNIVDLREIKSQQRQDEGVSWQQQDK